MERWDGEEKEGGAWRGGGRFGFIDGVWFG